ncbi:sugar phosphate isomerase/epimerase [Paenibacillus sp. HB172176]|uniref:sugar phosphate isomerase/epimerase family protein n=1 Tax=Paenibacillus sp. HB172176 TaxID=2493690 RepID=UPI00143A289F|nr:sugar phosphate isomerase/epimerase [Paenibacillus sp. HB172176]
MKIALQLFTLHKHLTTPDAIRSTFEKVKKLGFNYVEVAGIKIDYLHEVSGLLKDTGLTAISAHIGYQDLLQPMENIRAKRELWGCRYFTIGGMPPEYREDKEGYAQFISIMTEGGLALKRHGLELLYHNHAFEFCKFDGNAGMELLADAAGRGSYGMELDVHWVQAGGGDPVDWILRLKDKAPIIHLKDYSVTSSGERRFAEIGRGNLHFERILEACEVAGAVWGVVEQDDCYARDPFEALADSVECLKKLGAEF